MEFEITEPQDEHELSEAFRLRYERLRKPQGMPEGSEQDPQLEKFSTHVIAKVGDRVVGSGVYVVLPTRAGLVLRFRQVAIDDEFEGQGIAKAITDHVEAQAIALGVIEMQGTVREDRVSYFKQFGYEENGERMTVFGIPHVGMSRHYG